MRDNLIKLIFNRAKKNRNILMLTADLGYSLFDDFATKLPKQFFNVGISEQNMISLILIKICKLMPLQDIV